MEFIINGFQEINISTLNNISSYNSLSEKSNISMVDHIKTRHVLTKFSNWVIENKSHTFPKNKSRWLNIFRSDKKRYLLILKRNPEVVLLNIINNYKIDQFEQKMYKNIINYISKNNIVITLDNYKNFVNYISHFTVIRIDINPVNIFEILVQYHFLIINDNKKNNTKLNLFKVYQYIEPKSNTKRKIGQENKLGKKRARLNI